jgi:hypothetical protein
MRTTDPGSLALLPHRHHGAPTASLRGRCLPALLLAIALVCKAGTVHAQSHHGSVLGDVDDDGRGDIILAGGVSPGGAPWVTIPVAHATGTTFTVSNDWAPDFARKATEPGAQVVAGDFDGDRHTDVAIIGRASAGLPIAFRTRLGWQEVDRDLAAFTDLARTRAPRTATAVAGDFDGNGCTDIALVGGYFADGRPRDSIAVALANRRGFIDWHVLGADVPKSLCDGTFSAATFSTGDFAIFANQLGAQVVAADFNHDGCSDLALTGGWSPPPTAGAALPPWGSVPVALSDCVRAFSDRNFALNDFPLWATQAGAKAVAGDFDGDGAGDIALTGGFSAEHLPWGSIPVAFSNWDGTFRVTNLPAVEFALYSTQVGAQVIATDLDGDGDDDLALTGGHIPAPDGVIGPSWTTIPIARSNRDGSFTVSNPFVPDFPGYATQGQGASLPATAASYSQARRHQLQVFFENIDDTGRLWKGAMFDREPFTPCDVDTGFYPRHGTCDYKLNAGPIAPLARFILGFGNGGGSWASGTARFIVDGQEVYRRVVDRFWYTRNDWFWIERFDFDYQHGTLRPLP